MTNSIPRERIRVTIVIISACGTRICPIPSESKIVATEDTEKKREIVDVLQSILSVFSVAKLENEKGFCDFKMPGNAVYSLKNDPNEETTYWPQRPQRKKMILFFYLFTPCSLWQY